MSNYERGTCPGCGPEDVDKCAGEPEDVNWTSQCRSCRMLWGRKTTPDGDAYSFSHSSAEMKALESMGG